jgi:hypothetical protein
MVQEEVLLRLKVHIPATFVKDFRVEKVWRSNKNRGTPSHHMKSMWRINYKGVEVGELPTQKHIRAFIKSVYIREFFNYHENGVP